MCPVMKFLPTLGAGLALTFFPASARTWTEAESGRTVEADLVGRTGEKVTLKRADGRTFEIAVASLSKEDRDFIAAKVIADWPSWRGPDRDGHSPDTGLLKEWPDGGPKLLWTFEKAGTGYSCPAVVGGKIYFTGERDGGAEGICLDASGKALWSATIGEDGGRGWLGLCRVPAGRR